MSDQGGKPVNRSSKCLALAKRSDRLKCDSEDMMRDETFQYISEVTKVGIMRGVYKEKTQAYMDKRLKSTLEKEKEIQLQIEKVQLLVNHNKSLLRQMDKQRAANYERIGGIVRLCNSALEKTNSETKEVFVTTASIMKLLSDIVK